jgi:hypothetical protein
MLYGLRENELVVQRFRFGTWRGRTPRALGHNGDTGFTATLDHSSVVRKED